MGSECVEYSESCQKGADGGYISTDLTFSLRGTADAYRRKTDANGNVLLHRVLGVRDKDTR